jgi:large subunit ribosomal protein L10
LQKEVSAVEKFGKVSKLRMLDEFIRKIEDYPNIFVIGYDGLSSQSMQTLRSNLKSNASECLIIKNKLAEIALEKKNLSQLCKFLKGMSAFVFSGGDPILTSKILVNISREAGTLKIFGGLLEGNIYSDKEINELSTLPPKEILLTRVLICINAPLTKLANSLNAVLKKLLLTLKEISGKKTNSY